MRRLLAVALLMALLLCFSGCSTMQPSGSIASTETTLSTEEITQSNIDPSNETTTPIISDLGIIASDVRDGLSLITEWSDIKTINDTSGITIDYFISQYGTISAFCYSDQTLSCVSAVAITVDSEASSYICQQAEKCLGFLAGYAHECAEITKFETSSRMVYAIYAPDWDMSVSNLPLTIRDASPNDFFSNEDRMNEYERLYESYNFLKLKDLASAYIDEFNPAATDSVYDILTILDDDILSITENCLVDYDLIENNYTANYIGASQISKSVCVAPLTTGSHFEITIGFQRDNWLFFDDITFSFPSSDQKLNYGFDSWDVNRDVLRGSISEYASIDLDGEEIDLFRQADDVYIRFENSDNDQVYDHKLSDDERTAIVGLYDLRDTYVSLSNLLYRWKNC